MIEVNFQTFKFHIQLKRRVVAQEECGDNDDGICWLTDVFLRYQFLFERFPTGTRTPASHTKVGGVTYWAVQRINLFLSI